MDDFYSIVQTTYNNAVSSPTSTVHSRAYHLVEKVVDAHCVRDEGGFTLHWLVRFIGLVVVLGLGYI